MRFCITFIISFLCFCLCACTGYRPLPAPPEAIHNEAELEGFPGIRIWGDVPVPDLVEYTNLFARQLRAEAQRQGGFPDEGRLNALILSGGGSDGPFGAGLLVGWTETGHRPEFTLVTGISAGALLAPFAFLGPEYDDAMREIIFRGATEGLVNFRIVEGLVDGLGLLDNTKLRRILREHITPKMVLRLAEEHNKGRRLLIGTTNLDAERPVLWRIDLLAKNGVANPEATADLITDILIASSAIPGAFPPQYFAVTASGNQYSEMHVDGAVTQQLFFYPSGGLLGANLPPDIRAIAQRGTLYVILNGKLISEYDPVEPNVFQIATRSFSTALKFGLQNDIRKVKQAAAKNEFGLKITAVPNSFKMDEEKLFDPAYMQALFELGRKLASDPDVWYLRLAPKD